MAEKEEAGPLNFLPGIPGLNVFWGNDKGPGSYQSLEMRRRIAERLAAQKRGFPKNIGEGLTYLGESIGEAGALARLEAAERAYQASLGTETSTALTPATSQPAVAPAVAPAAAPARVSEAATEAPVTVTASTDTNPAPATTAAPPVEQAVAPATTTAPPPVNDTPAAEAFRQQYLTGRGISPTATDVSLPPPVEQPVAAAPSSGTVQPPLPRVEQGALNSTPAAEQIRQQFLATRGNPFFNPGPSVRLQPGTTAPTVSSALQRPERVYDASEFNPIDAAAADAVPPFAAGERVPLPPPRPVYNRNPQIAELEANPALRARIQAIAKGELDSDASPAERQAAVEEIFNRAAARGHSLDRVTQMYTGPGSIGYYPASTFRNGARVLPGETEAFEKDVLTPVLRGSDVGGQTLGFSPTGNASGGVAARGVKSGRYNISGRFPGGSAETYVQQERPEQLARLADTRLTPQGEGGPREQIAATLAARQMQPARSVSNLQGSQQFGTGESAEAVPGYGLSIPTAEFPPPPATAVAANGVDSSEVAQAARMRDVVGLSRAGVRNPATASLGRTGVVSDAPLPGLAPLPSATDAGIAKTIEQRNKITDELLQQNAPTAPVVPQPDPTQPGTELSPTEAPSSSPTTSPALPRYAQATFADRFADVAPSAAPAAQPAAPPPVQARPPAATAPRIVDIPVAPQGVPAPGDRPQPQAPVPPAPELGADKSQPLPPDPIVTSPEEIKAQDILRRHPGDPNYAALAAEVAKPGIERRTAINKANHDAYLKKLEVWSKDTEAKNTARLPKSVLELEEKSRGLSEARQKDELRNMWGGLDPDKVLEPIKESQKNIVKVPQSQMAVRNVLSLVENDKTMFTGKWAESQTELAKLKILMGRGADDPRPVNTETFKAYIASIVAQNRQMLAGNANISDPDMAAAREASGGNINLERGSILAIMRGIEKSNALAVANHNRMLLQASGGENTSNPNLQSTLYNQYGVDTAQVVPRAAVDTLRRLAADPDKADRAISQFDKTFSHPGLARRILRGG